MKYIFLFVSLNFMYSCSNTQGLKLIDFYKSEFVKDSGVVYHNLGVYIISDSVSRTVYLMQPNCKKIILPRRTFFEIYDDKYLVCSINEIPQIGSSKPIWTFPREVLYIIPLLNRDSACQQKIYECRIDRKLIFSSDTLKHINKNYKFDLALTGISILKREMYFKKLRNGKQTISIKLEELEAPVNSMD